MAVRPTLALKSKGEDVKELQRFLNGQGYKLLIDGEFGESTAMAVVGYQARNNLSPDGIVGPMTAARMNTPATPHVVPKGGLPPWMEPAIKMIGTKEIAGRIHNDAIIGMWRKLSTEYKWAEWVRSFTTDEIPWCGGFVAYCLSEVGIEPDREFPSALSWADWGQKLNGPAPGAVCVKTRSGGGHVAFVLGKSGNSLAILGGNQGNMVKVSNYAANAFDHFRWPLTVKKPELVGFNHLPHATTDGRIGESER